MSNISIDICIATFHRPLLLKNLLQSIFEQKVTDEIKFRIIVIDNDKHGSARQTIEIINSHSPVEIVYDIEPIQNIALVRNKALSLANGDYVIFIDDDEIAESDWLQNITRCALEYNADVVFAPVLPLFPKNTPDWVIKGRFFDRERSTTGTTKNHGGTGNTLVKRILFSKYNFLFNEKYGLTGGSDTELFHRISKAGFKLIWCDSAIVSEEIIAKRLTAKWLIKRAFRGGQTFARIFVPDLNISAILVWLIRRVLFISICLVFLPICWIGGRHWLVKCLQKIASNLGQLLGFTGWQYLEYKT